MILLIWPYCSVVRYGLTVNEGKESHGRVSHGTTKSAIRPQHKTHKPNHQQWTQHSTARTSTSSSLDDWSSEVGRGISTLVGGPSVKEASTPSPMQISSRSHSKRSTASESLSISSSTNVTSPSPKSAKKKAKKEKKPTDKHLQFRAVSDAGYQWELEL